MHFAADIGSPQANALVIGLPVGVTLFAVFQLQYGPSYHKGDYRSIERVISQQAPKLPVFVVGPVGGAAVVLKYYGLSVAQEVPDAATGTGAVRGPRRLGWRLLGRRRWRAGVWDPVVTARLLENRQWERTRSPLQVYRVKMTSASDSVRSAVE